MENVSRFLSLHLLSETEPVLLSLSDFRMTSSWIPYFFLYVLTLVLPVVSVCLSVLDLHDVELSFVLCLCLWCLSHWSFPSLWLVACPVISVVHVHVFIALVFMTEGKAALEMTGLPNARLWSQPSELPVAIFATVVVLHNPGKCTSIYLTTTCFHSVIRGKIVTPV